MEHKLKNLEKPAVIVLAKSLTGLATLRALSRLDIELHVVFFDANDPIAASCFGIKNYFPHGEHNDKALLTFLVEYTQKLGNSPVVIPTSDSLALFLARNHALLGLSCRLWETTYDALNEIISKDGLYRLAISAGVDTIPWIVTNHHAELREWCVSNPAPYLLKPFYVALDIPRPFEKNFLLHSRDALLNYAATYGTDSIIVQRMIEGGDGYIFDSYGYCDRTGKILTIASHRRLRQYPPDLGSTCFGEIPAKFGEAAEHAMFAATERLLSKTKYHGIFGIEWLYDRTKGKFYLIDFNARPFSSIGHLEACGMNLPALAYLDLTLQLPSNIEYKPALKHIVWIDLLRDLQSLRTTTVFAGQAVKKWLASILRSASFGHQSWRDPIPGIHELATIVQRTLQFLLKKHK